MRQQRGGFSLGGVNETGPGVKNLIIANTIVFILTFTAMASGDRTIYDYFALQVEGLLDGAVYQLLTYQFLHGGLLHILVNMFVLWMFGRRLEDRWGTYEFVQFYLLCGVGGGLAIMTMQFFAGAGLPVVGASGAVLGIIGAHAVLWPDEEIVFLLFFIIPVPMTMKLFAVIMGAFSLLAGLFETATSIAHMAHLGGMLTGVAYAYYGDPGQQLFAGDRWIPSFSLGGSAPPEQRDREEVTHREISERIRELRNKADALLGEINNNQQNEHPKKRKKLREISRAIEKLKNMR